jgi:hypothetical protein
MRIANQLKQTCSLLLWGWAILNAATMALCAPVDISSSIAVSAANEHNVLDRITRQITSTVDFTLTNTSSTTITTPFHATLELTTQTVQMPGALGGFGQAPYQTFYYDLSGKLTGGALAPGQGVAFTATFKRPSSISFQYHVRPYGEIPANQLPIADAGADRTVGLPAGEATVPVILDGSQSHDPDGVISEYRWTGTPDPDDSARPQVNLGAGQHTFSLVVVDNGGALSTFDTVTITVEPIVALAPPQLTVGNKFDVNEGTALDIPVSAHDPQGALVTLSAAPALAGAGFQTTSGNPAQGNFHYAPDFDQQGLQTIQVTARNQYGLTATQSVQINVHDINRPPTIQVPTQATVREGGLLKLTFPVSDPDQDVLTVETSGLPSRAYFIEPTRSLTFGPDFNQAGQYPVTLRVSDGKIQSAPQTMLIQVEDAPTTSGSGGSLELNVAPLPPITFQPNQLISGTVNAAPPSEPPLPISSGLITGLDPAAARAGETLQVAITGQETGVLATHFETGQTIASFGTGITVQSLNISDATHAVASIVIAPDAAPGPRSVILQSSQQAAVSLLAFNVLPGRAGVYGAILDSATSIPLSGALVSLAGVAISQTTGSDGKFALLDVPAGQATLVINAPDHDLIQWPIEIPANQTLDLGNLFAVPNVFNPDAPPSVSLQSILGRGLTIQTPGIDLDTAAQAIRDAMIYVGGSQAGVLDAYGNQLNPQIVGSGEASLLDKGVTFYAERLNMGSKLITLGELFFWVNQLVSTDPPMTLKQYLDVTQQMVNAAWADPTAPVNRITVMMFNPGRGQSPLPPALSPDTQLNAFQAYLFLQSFLVQMQELDKVQLAAVTGSTLKAAARGRINKGGVQKADPITSETGNKIFTSYWQDLYKKAVGPSIEQSAFGMKLGLADLVETSNTVLYSLDVAALFQDPAGFTKAHPGVASVAVNAYMKALLRSSQDLPVVQGLTDEQYVALINDPFKFMNDNPNFQGAFTDDVINAGILSRMPIGFLKEIAGAKDSTQFLNFLTDPIGYINNPAFPKRHEEMMTGIFTLIGKNLAQKEALGAVGNFLFTAPGANPYQGFADIMTKKLAWLETLGENIDKLKGLLGVGQIKEAFKPQGIEGHYTEMFELEKKMTKLKATIGAAQGVVDNTLSIVASSAVTGLMNVEINLLLQSLAPFPPQITKIEEEPVPIPTATGIETVPFIKVFFHLSPNQKRLLHTTGDDGLVNIENLNFHYYYRLWKQTNKKVTHANVGTSQTQQLGLELAGQGEIKLHDKNYKTIPPEPNTRIFPDPDGKDDTLFYFLDIDPEPGMRTYRLDMVRMIGTLQVPVDADAKTTEAYAVITRSFIAGLKPFLEGLANQAVRVGNGTWSPLKSAMLFLDPAQKILQGVQVQMSGLSEAESKYVGASLANGAPPVRDVAASPFDPDLAFLSIPDPIRMIYRFDGAKLIPFVDPNFDHPGQSGLALDYQGNLYSDNAASDGRFGGRLFKFDGPFSGTPGSRVHTGQVNYYSYLIQVAHPANPVSMVMYWRDLFVADAADQTIKRVAVNAEYDATRRVGQPHATSPDFSFTPQSSMTVDPGGQLYITQGDFLFRVWSGGGFVETSTPDWFQDITGIDLDEKGYMYIAERGSHQAGIGSIYCFKSSEISSVLFGNVPLDASQLAARRIINRLSNPDKIVTTALGERYKGTDKALLVADDDAFQAIPFGMSGVVYDKAGNPIPDAIVRVMNRLDVAPVRTDSLGVYRFSSLQSNSLGRDLQVGLTVHDAQTDLDVSQAYLVPLDWCGHTFRDFRFDHPEPIDHPVIEKIDPVETPVPPTGGLTVVVPPQPTPTPVPGETPNAAPNIRIETPVTGEPINAAQIVVRGRVDDDSVDKVLVYAGFNTQLVPVANKEFEATVPLDLGVNSLYAVIPPVPGDSFGKSSETVYAERVNSPPTTRAIYGFVEDANGNALSGARVVVRNGPTELDEILTAPDGYWAFAKVPLTPLTVKVFP